MRSKKLSLSAVAFVCALVLPFSSVNAQEKEVKSSKNTPRVEVTNGVSTSGAGEWDYKGQASLYHDEGGGYWSSDYVNSGGGDFKVCAVNEALLRSHY